MPLGREVKEMEIDLNAEIEKANQEMNGAEVALMKGVNPFNSRG